MTDPVVDTIEYYDRYGHAFAAQMRDLDLAALYQRFLCHVRLGGRILDAGCRPGRDALAFAERGCKVVPLTVLRQRFGRVVDGHLFIDHTAATLHHVMAPAPVTIGETWISGDIRSNRQNEYWLNAIARHAAVQSA